MFLRFVSLIAFLCFSTLASGDPNPPAPTPAPAPAPAPAPKELVTLSREDLNKLIADAAKGQGGGGGPGGGDPNLTEIERRRVQEAKDKQDQERIVTSAKFNMRLETFLKEYAGVLPSDANEIPKTVTSEKYPNENDRASAAKAALMQAFFKEEENQKLLSESQLAKWKAYQALGTVGRQEEAANMYEVVFEPAINQARATRQARIISKEESLTGSSDSDIIFRKMHQKQLRSIQGNYPLNDVLHEQASSLGLVAKT